MKEMTSRFRTPLVWLRNTKLMKFHSSVWVERKSLTEILYFVSSHTSGRRYKQNDQLLLNLKGTLRAYIQYSTVQSTEHVGLRYNVDKYRQTGAEQRVLNNLQRTRLSRGRLLWPLPILPPLPSDSCLSFLVFLCVDGQLTNGGGQGRSQIIRQRESLVLSK
jgi:hypothetical protein